jgi:hypothetical protein
MVQLFACVGGVFDTPKKKGMQFLCAVAMSMHDYLGSATPWTMKASSTPHTPLVLPAPRLLNRNQ